MNPISLLTKVLVFDIIKLSYNIYVRYISINFLFERGNIMKNRLISTVLALALLCPMLSFFMVTDVNAALEVDDAASLVSSSNILYEEWSFDDMQNGEKLTSGYLASHANGNFSGLRKAASDNWGRADLWTAVADEDGGAHIYGANAYLALEDRAGMLLKMPYEVSFKLKVESCSASTTLLWWSENESALTRRALIRLSHMGVIGYTTSDSYTSEVYTTTAIEIGADAPWYEIKARINPVDGRMWLWVNGKLAVDGVVNEYLRDNSKSAEYSRLGIMYSWGGQTINSRLDDVVLTPVQVDEYIDFESAEAQAVEASWNLDDGKLTSKNDVSITAGSGYTVGNGILDITRASSSNTVNGPSFVLPGKASDYDYITFSFKIRANYSSNYANLLRVVKADGSTQNIFRIPAVAETQEGGTPATVSANLLANGGTSAGTLTAGEWSTMKITFRPAANKTTIEVDGKITSLDGNSTLKTVYDDLITGGKPFALVIYYHVGMKADFDFDDFSIKAAPATVGSFEDFTFEDKEIGATLTDADMNTELDTDLVSYYTESNSRSLVVSADPDNSANKAILNTNTRMHFLFSNPFSFYGKVTVSFDVKFIGFGGFTSFMSVNDVGGDGTLDNLIRLKKETAQIGYATAATGENWVATLEEGEDAPWYTFKLVITPKTGSVVWTVVERDTGVSVVNKTFTNSSVKAVYDKNLPLDLKIHHCWGSGFKSYFDNISIEALTPVERDVNAKWINPSFEMTTSPDVGDMANDDWEITKDPMLVAPSGYWDFNNGTISNQNGVVITAGTNMRYIAAENDTVNTTTTIATKTDKGERGGPIITLPGSVRNYEKINLSFKVKYVSASNWTNLFRVCTDGTNYSVLYRIPAVSDTATSVKVTYRTAGTSGSESNAKINKNEWATVNMEIDPATGAIKSTINGTEVNFTSKEVKKVYDNDISLKFYTYFHTGMTAEVYIDDVSVSAEYSKDFKDALGYSKNNVLKTVTDAEGNTRGIFVIKDKEMVLVDKPFEISFDYMMNQKPANLLNLVKLKMTDNPFTIFRLNSDGTLYNYTSGAYANASSGKNIGLNVVSKKLDVGTWYNFRVVFDPNTGHVMGYVDNVLVCDYNINDVYTDSNKNPLGVTKNPNCMYIELASQYSASAIKINDSCFDNLRIRTLNYKEFTKTVISDADFNGMTAGELSADAFSTATDLYTRAVSGSFNVAGSDVNKYIEASVKANSGITVDLIAPQTVTVEANFNFTELGEDGCLDIFKLQSGDGELATFYRAVSVNGEGELSLGGKSTGVTVAENTTYAIKLVYSDISGTAELYLNDEFIAAADITFGAMTGNVAPKRFLVNETDITTLSGVKLQKAEMPSASDYVNNGAKLCILSAEGDSTWGVIFDELSIYRDERSNFYVSGDAEAPFSFNDHGSALWGNDFVASFNYDLSATELTSLVEWVYTSNDPDLVDGVKYALAKVNGNKLYAADGTTELATLNAGDRISIAVSSNYWESEIAADNFVINATVYVNGDEISTYNVANTEIAESVALNFAAGISDAVVYYGNTPRDNRVPADASGVKFEGFNAFSVDFEDALFFESAETNDIDYVEWAYPARGYKMTDYEDSKVTLAEYITEGDNSFFRIRRPEINNKPTAYMEYNVGAMGEYSALYSVSLDIRYVDNIASSLTVATLYDENMSGKLKLLMVDYEGKLYFENNGVRYYLCDGGAANLTVNKPSDDEFTKIALVINEAAGTYSIWVNGRNAWYYEDGRESGSAVRADSIALNYTDLESFSLCDPKIRLFEGSNNSGSDSVADVDNISIDVIKSGYAPKNVSFQTSELGDDIRFVATLDTLYVNEVGFDIVAVSGIDGTKTYTDSTNVVFSSIEAAGETVLAESLGGRYISVLSIKELKVDDYSFTVKPFVILNGEKIYGDEIVYEYAHKVASAE